MREIVIRSFAEVHINSTLNIHQSNTDNDLLRVSIRDSTVVLGSDVNKTLLSRPKTKTKTKTSVIFKTKTKARLYFEIKTQDQDFSRTTGLLNIAHKMNEHITQ